MPDSDDDTDGTQRSDLVSVFLTGVEGLTDPTQNAVTETATPSEVLRLNMAVPPAEAPERLGVLAGDAAGYPNGRRLTDDVVDIALQAVAGALLGEDVAFLGDAVNTNEVEFTPDFPYVGLPHETAVNLPQLAAPVRIAGENRYATAAALATLDGATADTVLIANGDSDRFPDSMVASYRAGESGSPLLLVRGDSVPEVTADALEALGAEDVVIVGGTAAVGESVAAELAADYGVTRLSGADRYGTARAVVEGTDRPLTRGTAILADGGQFPDALVSGPLAYAEGLPLLLTRTEALPADTRAVLDGLVDEGLSQVVIAGGTAAVSDDVVAELEDLDLTVLRLGGATRVETAALMAEYAFAQLGFVPDHVNLARGDEPADALSAGMHAGEERAPILLASNPGALGEATAAELRYRSTSLLTLDVVGGTAAVSPAVVEAAVTAGRTNTVVPQGPYSPQDTGLQLPVPPVVTPGG